jgi:hypothetical protein
MAFEEDAIRRQIKQLTSLVDQFTPQWNKLSGEGKEAVEGRFARELRNTAREVEVAVRHMEDVLDDLEAIWEAEKETEGDVRWTR